MIPSTDACRGPGSNVWHTPCFFLERCVELSRNVSVCSLTERASQAREPRVTWVFVPSCPP